MFENQKHEGLNYKNAGPIPRIKQFLEVRKNVLQYNSPRIAIEKAMADWKR